MASVPKKRAKLESKTLRRNPNLRFPPIGGSMEPPETLLPSKVEFARLLGVVAIASAVAFACSFFVGFMGSSPKPFCDNSFDSIDSDPDICEPCPENGQCYQGKLECNHGYRKQGNICVEDGEISQLTRKLMEQAERKVCEAYAQNACYGTGTIWIPEKDVWEDLHSNGFTENLDERAYLYAKGKALQAVDELLEKHTNSIGIKDLKCPESLAESYKPFTCQIREWFSRHSLIIIPACALLVGCTLIHQKIRRKRYLSRRVEELYLQVCDILEENALSSKSLGSDCEPWVVASRLRDHLLLPRERKHPLLWRKVEELIQEDSRVDRYPKLVKGETKVVWEWQVEGSLSASKLKKGRARTKFRPTKNLTVNLQEEFNGGIAEPSL